MIPTSHQFSPLDEVIPPLYNGLIYGFPCTPDRRSHVLSVLQAGLLETLQYRPYLTADILRNESQDVRPGSLMLKVPEPFEEIKITVQDLTLPGSTWKDSYEDLRAAGMPLSKMDPKVLAPYVAGTATTTKVLTAQMNFIPGGCLFTICMAHAFVDAYGAAIVIDLWAKHCRKLQNSAGTTFLNSNAVEFDGICPALQRPISQEDFDRLKQRPELWKLLGLHWEDNLEPPKEASSLPTTIPAAGMAIPGMRACMFSFSPEAVKQLKSDATPDAPEWISTKDALAALLWRSVMRARFPPSAPTGDKKDSIVSVAIDGRSLMSPKIPMSYIGNVVFCCMTELSLEEVLSPETTLASLAVKIRKSIEAVKDNPQLIADAVDLSAGIPDVRQLHIAFKDFFGTDLITTSWIDIPFYTVDFGPIFGKTGSPEFFRIPKGQFGGICSLQSRQADGSFDVIIGLVDKPMTRLMEDVEFAKYAKFLSE